MGNCIVHCTLKRQLEFGFVLGALCVVCVYLPNTRGNWGKVPKGKKQKGAGFWVLVLMVLYR